MLRGCGDVNVVVSAFLSSIPIVYLYRGNGEPSSMAEATNILRS